MMMMKTRDSLVMFLFPSTGCYTKNMNHKQSLPKEISEICIRQKGAILCECDSSQVRLNPNYSQTRIDNERSSDGNNAQQADGVNINDYPKINMEERRKVVVEING